MRVKLVVVSMLVLAGLVAVGCGGGKAAPTPTQVRQAAVVPTVVSAPAVAQPPATATPVLPPPVALNSSPTPTLPPPPGVAARLTPRLTPTSALKPTPTVVPKVGELFDSGLLTPGKEYSYTFNRAGTYAYFCKVHETMTATVTVTTASSGAPVMLHIANLTHSSATVPAGTKVTWANHDAATHTVTSGAPGDAASGSENPYMY